MTDQPQDKAFAESIGVGNVGKIFGGGFIFNFYGTIAPAEPTKAPGEIPLCPYKGLAYFGPDDAVRFFGRDAGIEQLTSAVGGRSLTALVGPSGSGKSSVVLAGLAPSLYADGKWVFTYFRIAENAKKNPFSALASALAPLTGAVGLRALLRETEGIADDLQSGKIGIATLLDRCRRENTGRRILVIADQFEEVFTLVEDEETRRRFIDLIVEGFARQLNPSGVALILTLRADFYEKALLDRKLSEALQDRVVNLGPMTRDELRAAIERPAVPVVFRDGLVDTLMDEVESQPSVLPLLQFAPREMWSHLEAPEMTRANYEAIGGLKGALRKRADTIYSRLTKNGCDAAAVSQFRMLFTRLVNFGEGAADTRRTAGHDELGINVWRLAQDLAGQDNRLVVVAAPAPGKETVEIAHEALIANWPALRALIEADRSFGAWLRHLRTFHEEHRNHPKDTGALLRGGPLAVALEWREKRGADLCKEELAFLDQSVRSKVNERRSKLFLYATLGILFAIVAAGGLAALHYDWLRLTAYWLFNVRGYAKSSDQDRLFLDKGITFKECRDCPEMIFVHRGSFERGGPLNGSPDKNRESPIATVDIQRSFAVSVTEVTFAQWDICATYGQCRSNVSAGQWERDGKLPVMHVSWKDAQDYGRWISNLTGRRYRLLSEAEWEFAARGGKQSNYAFPDADLDAYAWDSRNAKGGPQAVRTRKASPYGIYDMNGNVAEWVEDCFHETYLSAPQNEAPWITGPNCDRRVVRGGGWQSDVKALRSASRDKQFINDDSSDSIGFRIARETNADQVTNHVE